MLVFDSIIAPVQNNAPSARVSGSGLELFLVIALSHEVDVSAIEEGLDAKP